MNISNMTFFLTKYSKAKNYLVSTLFSVVFFACVYFLIQVYNNSKLESSNKRTQDNTMNNISVFDSLLFSLVTQTTVGFAWSIPSDNLTKVAVFFQLLSIILITYYTLNI